jgi:membrane protein implicated in regulation of membrane protease activity
MIARKTLLSTENAVVATLHKDNMADSTLWWLAAGGLISVELITGTFYLLMISLGLIAAALAAHAGLPLPWQLGSAALVGCGSVLAWRAYKQSQPAAVLAQANPDVNMDVGETVHVDHWQDDNTCSVKYRGAHWDAALQKGQAARAGSYLIAEVVGNRLILKQPNPS